MARICTNTLSVVLGPCTQCTLCEASEQKGQKNLNENIYIGAQLFTPFDCSRWADNFGVLKRQSRMKNDRVIWAFKFVQKWHPGPFWANNWSFWPHLLRYGLQICFADRFKSKSNPNWKFYPTKPAKNAQKLLYPSSCFLAKNIEFISISGISFCNP